MFLQKLRGMTVDKFIIEEKIVENAGFLYNLSRPIVNGNSIWTGRRFRIVLPYGFLALTSFLLAASVFLNIYLHTKDISWFKSMIDLSFTTGVFVISMELMHNSNTISELCEEFDKWWWYLNLEEETIEFKRDIEKKLIFLTEYGFYFLNAVGSVYVLIPFLRYLYNGATNPTDMMAVNSLPDEPWVYFEIFGGAVVIYTCTNSSGHLMSLLVAVTFTGIAQLRLAGIACESIDRRVSKFMEDNNIKFSEGNNQTYDRLVGSQIKSCAKHYQAIYRNTKEFFQSIYFITNHINYDGCVIFIALGVTIIKKGENLFFLCQTTVAALCTMYCFSFVCESITDEVEILRLTIYSLDWYNFPVSSRKNVHIMQTMLMYFPKLVTVMGSEVTSENFSKVLHVGYCYITTILSTDLK